MLCDYPINGWLFSFPKKIQKHLMRFCSFGPVCHRQCIANNKLSCELIIVWNSHSIFSENPPSAGGTCPQDIEVQFRPCMKYVPFQWTSPVWTDDKTGNQIYKLRRGRWWANGQRIFFVSCQPQLYSKTASWFGLALLLALVNRGCPASIVWMKFVSGRPKCSACQRFCLLSFTTIHPRTME